MKLRRLIRNSKTGLFYDGHGGWTPSLDDARNYDSVSAALKAGRYLDFGALQLLTKYSNFDGDTLVPFASYTVPSSLSRN